MIGCALVLLTACGDDDADSGDSGPPGGGSGGTAAPNDDAGSGARPLGDGIAGKACTDAGDCGGATCAMQLSGTELGAQPLAAPGGYCTTMCTADTECGAGGACIGALGTAVPGQCHAVCTDSSECREGYVCGGAFTLGGLTIPDTCRSAPDTDQLGDDVAGGMCAADTDCTGGRCLQMRQTLSGAFELPGGYCSGRCLEDAHCGAGGVCLPALLGGAGSCYEGCEGDSDCTREGYRCRPLRGEIRGCNPAADPLPDATAGDACTGDADCGGGAGSCAGALPEAGVAGLFGGESTAPGGYCSQSCLEDLDCGAGGACVGAGLGSGACFARCSETADCRAGYLCEDRSMGGGATADAGAAPALTVCAPEPVAEEDAGAG